MDTSSLGWIIFFYGPVLVVLYLLIWQLIRGVSKTVRTLRPASGVETTKNRRLSWIFMVFLVLGLLFLYALIFTKEQPPDGPIGTSSSVFDNKWGQLGLAFSFFLSAIISSWLIHPLQKPGASRFDKYLGISWMRRHKYLTQIIIIIAVIVGIVAYQLIALELNKRAFAHARTAIDTVYADIVSQVGPPDDFKKSDTCSQSYVESIVTTKGPIGCNIDTVFIYGVKDEDQATLKLKRIQSIVSSHDRLFKPTKALSLTITTAATINNAYKGSGDEYKSSGLNCVINYIYDTPHEIELSLKNTKMKPLEIVIGCYGSSRAIYYPASN